MAQADDPASHPPQSADEVRIDLLGPVTLRVGGVTTAITGRQQAILLSLLSMEPGRVRPSNELIERTWGGRGPATAHAALRVHLARVRAALGPHGAAILPPGHRGYVLMPGTVSTDVAELGDLLTALDAAADDPERRLALAEAALALWRGQPFGGFHEDVELRIEAERLEETRLDLQDVRAESLIELERFADAARELASLVAAKPLRERRSRLLMLTQYRAGRQADALATFRALRDRLLEEVGTDPDQETRQLEVRILRQDPDLAASPALPAEEWVDEGRPTSLSAVPRPNEALLELVAERLDRLTPDAALLVRLVAVLGRAARPAVLAGALGSDLGPAQAEAEESGLVCSVGGAVTLAQESTHDAVLWLLDPAELARVDRIAGHALIELGDGPTLLRGAWHLLRSPDDVETVRVSAVRAADACLAAGQFAAAASVCEAGLALGPAATPAAIDLGIRRVRALALRGQTAEAEAAWREVVARARQSRDAGRFALAVLERHWAARSFFDSERGYDALLDEALAGLGARASALRVRVLAAHLLEVARGPHSMASTARLVAEVAEQASLLGDAESLASALHVRHALLRGSPDRLERERVASDFVCAARGTGDPSWCAIALLGRLYDDFVLGRLDTVAGLMTELDACAARARDPRILWHRALTQASLHRDLGDFAEAERWANQAAVVGTGGGVPDALGAVALQRFQLAALRLGAGSHLAELTRFLDGAPGLPIARAALALSHAENHDHEAAARDVRAVLDALSNSHPESVPPTLMLIGEAAALGPDAQAASALRLALGAYAGEWAAFGQVVATFGPVDRVLGKLAFTAGDEVESLALLDAAVQSAQEAGARPWAVVAATDRVQVLRRLGRADEAAACAVAVVEQALALGMPAWAERARS